VRVVTIGAVVLDIVRHPVRSLILRWHWKSATLSAIVRGGLFFAANAAEGVHAAARAAMVEAALAAPLVGLLAACIQAFRRAEPEWAATLVAVVFVPALAQATELSVHAVAGTPRLTTSVLASVALSVLSTLFSLFTMRRGILIVGDAPRSLMADVKLLPGTFLQFVATAGHCAARAVHPSRGDRPSS
jgi:hypothetical protein